MSRPQSPHDPAVALLLIGLLACGLTTLPSCASPPGETVDTASRAEDVPAAGVGSESARPTGSPQEPAAPAGAGGGSAPGNSSTSGGESAPAPETAEESARKEEVEAEMKVEVDAQVEARIEAEIEAQAAARPAGGETATTPAEPKQHGSWTPPEPGEGRFDWIRLDSGEWLKGDIIYMRNRKLEFESDKLNDLVLDWKDVMEVRSPRMNTVLLEGKVQHTGTLLIRDDVVVLGGDETRTYSRAQLVSIVPGEERERDYWSGKLVVGTTFRSGNTDQTDITARFTVYRRTALTRTTLDYTGAITTIDDREEVNNHRIRAGNSVYLTQDFYIIPFAIEYYKDRISNLRHRITPGAGGGYWLLDTSRFEWNVDLLGGYRYTEFSDVEAGDDKTETTAAVIAATKADLELTNDIDLILEYRIDVGLNNANNTNQSAISTLSIDLTKDPEIDLEVSFIWDRIGNPRRDADGDVPEKDDFRLVFGVGIDF